MNPKHNKHKENPTKHVGEKHEKSHEKKWKIFKVARDKDKLQIGRQKIKLLLISHQKQSKQEESNIFNVLKGKFFNLVIYI